MASVDLTRIASNIGALNALNSLQDINKQLSIHQGRLQTGKRINSASDDPAGLTIATKMLARSEGLKVALDNIGDAKNMLSVAEGGMSKINDILVQMRSKAEQAASDTLGASERQAIQTQLSAYSQQIQDLVDQTKWNGTKLLDQSTGTKTFQTGADEGENVTWTLTDKLDPGQGSLGLSTNVAGSQTANAAYSAGATSFTGLASAAVSGGTLLKANQSELATGGYSFEILDKATSGTQGKVAGVSAALSGTANVTFDTTTASASQLASGHYKLSIDAVTDTTSTTFTLTNLDDSTWGTNGSTTYTNINLAASGGALLATSGGNTLGVKLTLNSDPFALVAGQTTTFEYVNSGDAKVELNDSSNQAVSIVSRNAANSADVAKTYAYIDTGAAGSYVTGRGVTINYSAFATQKIGDKLGFDYQHQNAFMVDVSSAAKASAYMTTVNGAMDKVNTAMSNLGSLMARMTFKEDAVTTAQVNVEASYSRIMNANMAEEQVNASKFAILQQTATAMLAQANQAPQSLLSLFR